MNTELKNFLDVAFDGYKLVTDIESKSYFAIVGDLFEAAKTMPSIISNFGDLSAEIEALPGSEQQADLVSYVETKFANIGSAKAQLILSASLKLVMDLITDGVALKTAITS